jgi:predicted phage baseplate assembly protein
LVTLVSQTSAPPAGTAAAHTILKFAPAVTRRYALDGLVVYGNVAHATNGETVRNEIVGNGDASQGFQKFVLRKKPVTYALDRKTGIVNSSLTLLVNSVKWDEVPTLYGAAPADPVYTSRIADDTTMTLTFGDGVTGSRLPTGRQNVIAQYRHGIGAEGNVGAQRITNLVDRPKGLRGATNPSRAEGGVNPESLAGARVTAPGTVRTFGRAVSLRDFEDSALFNGIVAKASAAWVWTGERRAIHLTVAAADGGILSDEVKDQLRVKLDGVRDVNQRLLIDNYVRVPIVIDAALTVDDRHVRADVLAAARAALLATFAFEARGFGQPVFLSDLFSLLQEVPGVVAVDVNRLDLKSGNAAFRAAHGVDDTLGQPQPRLLILPARPDPASATVHPAELAVVDADTDLTLSATGGIPL